jgi:hypothetical protein
MKYLINIILKWIHSKLIIIKNDEMCDINGNNG